MQDVIPYTNYAGAPEALDNGGRFYNIFTKAEDDEVSLAELAKGAAIANTIAIAAPGQGKSLAKLRFGIPLTSRDAAGTKNVVIFDLHPLLDQG